MARRLITLVTVGGLGYSSFLAGTAYESRKHNNCLNFQNDSFVFKENPIATIFDTVFAASPVSPPLLSDSQKSSRVSQIMKYGFPSLDNVRSLDNFVLSYDRRMRVANWVFEHLSKENIKQSEGVTRSTCQFKPDESIHPYFRSENSDYKGSGYDRGHLAAAGNHKSSQVSVEQTFLLSNMAPQVGEGFNRGSWNRLEKYVRHLTRRNINVYCCTGPLYLPQKQADKKMYVKYEVIGNNSVAVPTHFFKVVVIENENGQFEMESFVLPNKVIEDSVPLESFLVPVQSIERAAGLLFFDNISKAKLVKINGKKQ